MRDPSAAAETVSADFGTLLGKRNNLSGFLHGWDGYKPGNTLIDAVAPAIHRVGLENAVLHYKRAKELKSDPELILIISDAMSHYYGEYYPGRDMTLEDFAAFIRTQYRTAIDGGVDASRVIIDVWNEPDGPCWNPYGSIRENRDSFMAMWKVAYDTVKELNPDQRIMGPGFSKMPEQTEIDTVGYGFFREWLDFSIKNDCLPDYISWHMLGEKLSPSQVVSDVREIFEERGLTCPPVVIDEVINDTDNSPGCAAWYLAQMQRSGVLYAGHAVWIRDRLDQLLFITDEGRWGKTGEYFMYSVYAQMDGELAGSTPTESLDLIAVSRGDTSYILLGNNMSFSGTAGVAVTGIAYDRFTAKLCRIPYNDGGNVTDADIETVWEQEYRNCGELSLAFEWGIPKDGYYLVIEKIG